MKKKLILVLCLSIHQLNAVKVLERDGKKHDIHAKVDQSSICEQTLFNPHMPNMMHCLKASVMDKSWKNQSLRTIFTDIYTNNYWQGTESLAGEQSSLSATRGLRQELLKLWDELHITTIVDAGCNDYYWMQTCDMKLRTYIGIDIVPAMIEKNRYHYADAQHYFLCLDVSTEIVPQADMIICRNVLNHVDVYTACAMLRNFKASGSTFLLLTTHAHNKVNHDILPGNFFPYNMTLPPFNLPAPLLSIQDGEQELALWLLQDINFDCLEY